MAGREDSGSPIRLARCRNVTVGEVARRWQQSGILLTFATGSEITMDNELMLKPGTGLPVLDVERIF